MRKWTRSSLSGRILLALTCGTLSAFPANSNRTIRIVVPLHPVVPVDFAAQELTRYLAAMGNPKPTVVEQPASGDLYLGCVPIRISAPERQEIQNSLRGKDSFVIRSVGSQLIIYGNSPRATLYGAYQYLETLGVRWYFPGRAYRFALRRSQGW